MLASPVQVLLVREKQDWIALQGCPVKEYRLSKSTENARDLICVELCWHPHPWDARLPKQDSHERFCLERERARQEGFRVGAKLVRGAYMFHERDHAAKKGCASPVYDAIEETHASYDR